MQTRRITRTLALAALLLSAPAALAQPADVLLVDGTAMGMDDGSTWDDAFIYLQDAIDEAHARNTDGDGGANNISEIWVAQGTYKPDLGGSRTPGNATHTFRMRSDVGIYGGFSGGETMRSERNADPETNNTVLSGDLNDDDDGLGSNRSDNSYHVVTANSSGSTLDGFTIENGGSTESNAVSNIEGGGIHGDGGSPTLRRLVLDLNLTQVDGGGMRFIGGAPTLIECTFRNNDAGILANYANARGGGISLSDGATLTAVDCRFEGNRAKTNGGAVQIIDSAATFINCEFLNNDADSNGGAVNAGGGTGSTVSMINCLVARNSCDGDRGGGLSSGGAGGAAYTLVNTTIANNDAPNGEGGGIGLGSGGSVDLANSIVYLNTDLASSTAVAQIFETDALSATVNYSNTQGGAWAGTGNISTIPLFINTGSDDYHLNASSACINAGDDASVPSDDEDLDADADTAESVPLDRDGNYRFRNGAVDMGAYESDFCTTDLNALDGTNIDDLLALLARWGACGAPCHPDTDGDGDVDINDLLALLAAWGACP